jgi:hypothetical protein
MGLVVAPAGADIVVAAATAGIDAGIDAANRSARRAKPRPRGAAVSRSSS